MIGLHKLWRRLRGAASNDAFVTREVPAIRSKCVLVDQRGSGPAAMTPIIHHNEFQVEHLADQKTSITIAASSNHVALLKELASALSEPLYMRHLLVEANGQYPAGRYDLPHAVTLQRVCAFLDDFQTLLTEDGRHSLFIASNDSPEEMLVYDFHGLIYGYGPIDAFCQVARGRGFRETEISAFPMPHGRSWHSSLNAEEDRLLSDFEWRYSPLQAGDDHTCDHPSS